MYKDTDASYRNKTRKFKKSVSTKRKPGYLAWNVAEKIEIRMNLIVCVYKDSHLFPVNEVFIYK
ncbi:hypothetical protein D0T51_09440 [Parabacteroides sp. 52]|nr:hypothetical protein [Parabacteroides sp. 52]